MEVLASVLRSPRKSLRRRSLALGVKKSTLSNMLKNLELKPYKIRQVQELKETDYGERVFFCNWFIERLNANPMLLFQLSDEAKFFVNGSVSSIHYWTTSSPNERCERSMDQTGVMVWMGITATQVIGPSFFEENVTQESYQRMLREFLFRELDRLNINPNDDVWFQQDGAPAHRTNATIALLREKFGDRVISIGSEVQWPPRSPDLSPCDSFLWGFLKQLVYNKKMSSL